MNATIENRPKRDPNVNHNNFTYVPLTNITINDTKLNPQLLLDISRIDVNSSSNVPNDNYKQIEEFTKGNYVLIFYILSLLSLIALSIFSYEVYRNHKINQILSGDLINYEYVLINDTENPIDKKKGCL